MTSALFIVAVVAAAWACPALMWWNARRGRRGCLSGRKADGAGDLESLRQQQTELDNRIGERDQETPVSSR